MSGGRRIERADLVPLAALAGALAASLALYVALALVLGSVPAGWDGLVGFSLPSGGAFRAFTGLPRLALSAAGFGRVLAAILVLLWAAWGGAALALRRISSAEARRRARWIVLLGGGVMLALVVVAVPPTLSADLYRQVIYGRMAAHGLNPYALAAAASADPLLAVANHTQVTTSYGPAYTWLSALAALLAPSSLVGAALTWKAMAALAALGCAALAARVARALRPGEGEGQGAKDEGAGAELNPALWIVWNPLVVIESAASGHIEPVMMLPLLAGILLLERSRPVRGFLLLTLSTLTKWVTGVVLLLAAVREIRRAPPGGKLRASLRVSVAPALLAALLYAPFAPGLGTRGGILDLALRGGIPLGDPAPSSFPQWAMMLGFAALSIGVARASTRGAAARMLAAATGLMLVFIVVVVPWLFPWYFVAPAVLAAVLPRRRAGLWLRLASIGLGAGVMLYYARLVPAR